MKRKRNSAFFGDVGTTFSGPAREDILKQENTAETGNNVDFSQRYAQSEDDGFLEQAERMMRAMERDGFRHFGQFADPQKRREFVEGLAEQLRGKPAMPARPQEPAEEPSLSRAADEKFWGNKEEQQRVARQVRPPRL